MIFVGIDPGEVTGLARWDSSQPHTTIEWLQVPHISIGPALRTFIQVGSYVGCERYIIGANTIRKSRTPTDITTAIIGRIGEVCETNSAKLYMQSSSDAKSFGHDRTMRRLGWYFSGHRHATDAARHLVLLVARLDVSVFETLVNDLETKESNA